MTFLKYIKALKDRRSRLARSRSSHEVVAHQQQGLPVPQHCGSGVEVEDTRTSTHAQVFHDYLFTLIELN